LGSASYPVAGFIAKEGAVRRLGEMFESTPLISLYSCLRTNSWNVEKTVSALIETPIMVQYSPENRAAEEQLIDRAIYQHIEPSVCRGLAGRQALARSLLLTTTNWITCRF